MISFNRLFSQCVFDCIDEHISPPEREESHHEVELGVLIGSRARRVSPEAAMEVFFFTFLNFLLINTEEFYVLIMFVYPW